MALNPDDTLNSNHYRIIRLLGRGGFGFVYLAQDTLLGEDVAIKELIPALVGDETMLKRFLAEARATMRLTHRHIVRTHNVFAEGGNYYIVMEYMAGGSLEERLRAQGALPVDEAVRLAAEVCEGLACAHEEQVVHCDLKPANILFDAAGRAKVADFGIAHVSGEMLTRSWMTPAGFVAGTLPYMSPEQTDGVRDEPRIDVYALGAMLYRALTGHTYLSFDPQETPRAQAANVGRIYSELPLPPSQYNRGIPSWLDGVVLTALAKRPEERFAGAEAMRAALLAQQPAPAPVASRPPLPPTRLIPARQPAQAQAAPAVRAASAAGRPSPLPAWFWPVAGAAAVLTVFLIIAIVALGNRGDGGRVVGAATATKAVPPETAVARRTLTNTPEQAVAPAETDPQPTATPMSPPTDTPQPTAMPTSTDIPPTSTPKPQSPGAGATETRSKDGMVMVYVPAGEFTMGSNDGEDDEQPVHTVTLDAFWIDRTEVTNAQFRKCVEAGACQAPTTCDFGGPTYNDGGKADHPVVCVSWSQAKAYCEWAGARLPTEAEWEKAARGTDGRNYPWGNQDPDCNQANYVGRDGGCVGDTSQVGNYPAGASPYGTLDLAGNVWEWVADWYDSGYYANSPSNNPTGPNSGYYRVLRGGSRGSREVQVRAAYRYNYAPADAHRSVGFRCVVSSPGE